MMDFLKKLFSSDYMPHGHCYAWSPDIVWPNVIADALIALAYFSIPLTLVYFVRRRRDIPYPWMFIMFGGFIVACGSTHVMEIWSVWHGTYRLSAAIKIVTALLSISTAIALVKLTPAAMTLRSPAELDRLNISLQSEIAERRRVETELRHSQQELERRVRERTDELTQTNAKLQQEIREHQDAEAKLRQNEERFRRVLDTALDAVISIDSGGKITHWNVQAETIFGWTKYEVLGRSISETIIPTGHREAHEYGMRHYLSTGAGPMLRRRIELTGIRRNGSEFPLELAITPVQIGDQVYFSAFIRDITERKKAEEALTASLREKETLLKEIHHRVKNNMQLISSVLQLQTGYIKDPKALAVFHELQIRIRSMALIHEKLYLGNSLAQIDFGDYVRSLVQIMMRTYSVNARDVSVELNVDTVSLNLETAIPLGLVINELISNCLKHAFPNQRPGAIRVSLRQDSAGLLQLTVGDNGIGLPADFEWDKCDSLGLRLIQILAAQLHGTIEVRRDHGTEITLAAHELKTHDRNAKSVLA